MGSGSGNIDAIKVALGADLNGLRSDLQTAKKDLESALPKSRTVAVHVNVNANQRSVRDLYSSIQNQFAAFQKGGGQADRITIAPRMQVDPRIMRDFRRDIERNMTQAGRSGQALNVPIKFNGDIKAFVASIGKVEVPVYGKWAGYSPGGEPPTGAGGGGGSAPRPPSTGPSTPPGAHRAAAGPKRGPAGGGPAPTPARGRPASSRASGTASGGTVVAPHVYYGTEVSSSDRYETETAPPTPRQQRQAARRAAMSGSTPPAPRGGNVYQGRGVGSPRAGGPAYVAPPGGRVDMANVRGGSVQPELQGDERIAFVSQQRARSTPAAGWLPQAGERTLKPHELRNNATLRRTLEDRAQRIRKTQAATRAASPEDASARAAFASGFHNLDPDLAAMYDILGDPTYHGSLQDLRAASSLGREAYGSAFHGQTDKKIRRQIQVIRGNKKGDINAVDPTLLAYVSALDASKAFSESQADPMFAVRSGDQKLRGRGGKVGRIGSRNAGRAASTTVDPSHVTEILARRRIGGKGNGWKALAEEFPPEAISVARGRIGANNPKAASENEQQHEAYAGVRLDDESMQDGIRTRRFTHVGERTPALPPQGGQGMFRSEPKPERPQPVESDRPGINPASLIGGGKRDLSHYEGITGRGPFGRYMDRRRALAMARQQSGEMFRFAEGGRPQFGKYLGMDLTGDIPGHVLRGTFGVPVPRRGSKARSELDERFRRGMRNREEYERKPDYQKGGRSGGPEWQANRRAILERERANGLRCAYCGQPTIEGDKGPHGTTVDHILDTASGGTHALSNLQIMDNQHNGMKSGGRMRRFAEGGAWGWNKKKMRGYAEGGNLDRVFGDKPGMWWNHATGQYHYDHERKTTEDRTREANEAWGARYGGTHGPRPSAPDSLEAKLKRMADQSASPNEAAIAKKKLRARGIPGYAEGGQVKRGGLADRLAQAGHQPTLTMFGERGPELGVTDPNTGETEIIPTHKVPMWLERARSGKQDIGKDMSGYAEGGIVYRGGGASGRAHWVSGASAAGTAVQHGLASSVGAIQRVFVTNWPTGPTAASYAASGAAQGRPAQAHAAAPGAGAAQGQAAPGPGAVPNAPPVGAGRVRSGGVDPYARVRAREISLADEDRENSRIARIQGVRAAGQGVGQQIPVRALSVSFGQLAQFGIGGRGAILARQRAANVAAARAQRAETAYTSLRQTGAETRSAIGDITSGRRQFDTSEDRDATLASLQGQYAQNIAARREARKVSEGRTEQAEVKQSGVLSRGQQIRSQAAGLGGIIAGTTLFSATMAAFSTATSAASTALSPLIQSMLGWPEAIDKTTTAIRDSITSANGFTKAGAAAAVAPSGISAAYLDTAGANLTATGRNRAAATAGAAAQDITRAAGAPAKGLYEGTGGLLGSNVLTELFGGQPGFLQTVAGRLGTNQSRSPGNLGGFPAALGDLAGSVNPLGENFLNPFAPGDKERAGQQEAQKKVIDDLNKNLQSAADYAGNAAGSFKILQNATDEQKKAMIESAAATSDEAKTRATQIANTGVAVVGPGGKNLVAGQFDQYANAQAQGQLIQDPTLLLRANAPARAAAAFGLRANAQFQRAEDIPAQQGLENIANPLGRIGASYGANVGSTELSRVVAEQADSTKATQEIAKTTQAGVAAMENIVSRIDNPSFAGGVPNVFDGRKGQETLQAGTPGPALTQFRGLVGQIGSLGSQIQGKTDAIAGEQATLQAHEYGEQIRLTNRSLGDAKDLWAGINGATSKTVGGLQGQNILLDRQNQLLSRRAQRLSFKSEDIGFKSSDLQIQAQNLGFAQSQRQINFNKAVAGFAAPGSTPEERAARIEEAKLEADYAQKQLDLQEQIAAQGREQLKIAKESAGINRQQFGIQNKQQDNAFAIQKDEAVRAIGDIQKQLALLGEGHKVTIDTAAAQEAITRLQKQQANLIAQAQSYVQQGQDVRSQVLADTQDLMKNTGKEFNTLVSSVENAWSEAFRSSYSNYIVPLNKYLTGLGSLGSSTPGQYPGYNNNRGHADGIIGSTNGPTQFMAGEAGREHVVVLRNAKQGTMGTMMMGAGGGGTTINVGGVTLQIEGGKNMDESKLADAVVDRLSLEAGAHRPMTTVLIKVNDVDVTAVVRYADAIFTSQVNGAAGPCKFAVRDLDHTKGFAFGQTITLDLDGTRKWAGFVQKVTRQYTSAVVDTTTPATRERWFLIDGFDNNVLFTRRAVFDHVHPTKLTAMAPDPSFADPDTTHHADMWAAGTHSDDIVKWVVANDTELPDDGVTTSGVDDLGSPNPDMAAAFAAAETVGDFMRSVNRLLGGIWYLTPDFDMVHRFVETATTDYFLSDYDDGDAHFVGPRDYAFTSDAGAMVNDALVWGTAIGVSSVKFGRSTDDDSVDAHGRWQSGEFNEQMYQQTSIDHRAHATVYGNDASQFGAHHDALMCKATIFDPIFSLGDVVTCKAHVYAETTQDPPFEDTSVLTAILPVRRITMTFPTPKDVRFDLLLTQELDEPWSTYEYVFPKFRLPKVPPFDGGVPGGLQPPSGSPGGCTDEICGIFDAFGRTSGSAGYANRNWDHSDTGHEWFAVADVGNSGTSAYVDGSQGVLITDGLDGIQVRVLDPASGDFPQWGLPIEVLFHYDTANVPAYIYNGSPTFSTEIPNMRVQVGEGAEGAHFFFDSPVTFFPSVGHTNEVGASNWGGDPGVAYAAGLTGPHWVRIFFDAASDYSADPSRGVMKIKVWEHSDPEPGPWTIEVPATGFSDEDSQGVLFFRLNGVTGTSNFTVMLDNVRVWVEGVEITKCSSAQFDDFGRAVASGWGSATPSGAVWTRVSATHAFSEVDPSVGGFLEATASAFSIDMQTPSPGPWDGEFTETTLVDVPSANLWSFYRTVVGSTNTFICSLFRNSGNLFLELGDANAGTNTADTGIAGGTEELVYVKWNLTGTTLSAKAWLWSTPEPGSWQVTATVTSLGAGSYYNVNWSSGGTAADAIVRSIEFDYAGKPCYLTSDCGIGCGPTDGAYAVFDDFSRSNVVWGTSSSGYTWTSSHSSGCTVTTDGAIGLLHVVATTGLKFARGNITRVTGTPLQVNLPFYMEIDVDHLTLSSTGDAFIQFYNSDTGYTLMELYLFPADTRLYTTQNGSRDTNGWYESGPAISGATTLHITADGTGITVAYGTTSLHQPWRNGSGATVTPTAVPYSELLFQVDDTASTSELGIGEIRIKDIGVWGTFCTPGSGIYDSFTRTVGSNQWGTADSGDAWLQFAGSSATDATFGADGSRGWITSAVSPIFGSGSTALYAGGEIQIGSFDPVPAIEGTVDLQFDHVPTGTGTTDTSLARIGFGGSSGPYFIVSCPSASTIAASGYAGDLVYPNDPGSDTDVSDVYTPGTTLLHIRFYADATIARIKRWTGSTEPDAWTLEATPVNAANEGGIFQAVRLALQANLGSTQRNTIYWDNLHVCAPATVPPAPPEDGGPPPTGYRCEDITHGAGSDFGATFAFAGAPEVYVNGGRVLTSGFTFSMTAGTIHLDTAILATDSLRICYIANGEPV